MRDVAARTKRAVLIAVRRVPVHQRVGLLAVVTLLTLVPALLSIPHSKSRVFVDLDLAPGVRHAPGRPLPYVQGVLRSQTPFLVAITSSRLGNPLDESFYRSIAVNPDPNRPGAGVRLSVFSLTPNRAKVALRLVATEIASASSTSSNDWFKIHEVTLPQLARTLARRDLSSAARRSILSQERYAQAAGGGVPAGPLKAGEVITSLNGLRAKVIAHLPGNPRAPSPFWAGAAGFILGLALCAAWIYMTASDPSVKLHAEPRQVV